MKKSQAERVKKIIDIFIKKHWLYKENKDIKTSIRESKHYGSPGWYGVYIATDGNWYDYLYSNEGYYVDEAEAKEFGIKAGSTGGIQIELEKFINKKMKWKKGDHYFELEGGGVLYIY
jgi:hypothetical protein